MTGSGIEGAAQIIEQKFGVVNKRSCKWSTGTHGKGTPCITVRQITHSNYNSNATRPKLVNKDRSEETIYHDAVPKHNSSSSEDDNIT